MILWRPIAAPFLLDVVPTPPESGVSQGVYPSWGRPHYEEFNWQETGIPPATESGAHCAETPSPEDCQFCATSWAEYCHCCPSGSIPEDAPPDPGAQGGDDMPPPTPASGNGGNGADPLMTFECDETPGPEECEWCATSCDPPYCQCCPEGSIPGMSPEDAEEAHQQAEDAAASNGANGGYPLNGAGGHGGNGGNGGNGIKAAAFPMAPALFAGGALLLVLALAGDTGKKRRR